MAFFFSAICTQEKKGKEVFREGKMKVIAVTKNWSQVKFLVPLHSSGSMEIWLLSTKLLPCECLLGRANDAKRCSRKSNFRAQSLIQLWSRRYWDSGKVSCFECKLFAYVCTHYEVYEKQKQHQLMVNQIVYILKVLMK